MTYTSMITPFLWAITLGALLGLLGYSAIKRKRKGVWPRRALIGAAVAAACAALVVPSIAVVPAGYRGVVYSVDGGVQKKPRGEGVTLIVPWLQHLTTVSVRTQKVVIPKMYAQSRDLQEITAPVSVNYHIDPTKAPHLYQAVGLNYAQTVIQPALFQRTKAAIGKIRAINFSTRRDALALKIQQQLISQLSGYGIAVEYVNVEDAVFDPAFVKAVKDKVIARQKAAEQHNLIAARRAQKTQTIINAQAKARSILIEATAQAQANRRIEQSLTGDLLRWKWLTTWNGILPSTVVGGNVTPLLGIGGGSGAPAYGG